MRTPESIIIKEIKDDSSNTILKLIRGLKIFDELELNNFADSLNTEIKKIKCKDLKAFTKHQDQTYQVIEQISSQFHQDCKLQIQKTIEIHSNNNEVINKQKYLKNLFRFIETCYFKSYHRLQFLKNNLGFVRDREFLTSGYISMSMETKTFIELRVEIVEKMINCFSYFET